MYLVLLIKFKRIAVRDEKHHERKLTSASRLPLSDFHIPEASIKSKQRRVMIAASRYESKRPKKRGKN